MLLMSRDSREKIYVCAINTALIGLGEERYRIGQLDKGLKMGVGNHGFQVIFRFDRQVRGEKPWFNDRK